MLSIMSKVSGGRILTKHTGATDESDVALSVEADELRTLEEALRVISGDSRAASTLVAAIEHALSSGRPLLLGAAEGLGEADEEQLRVQILALVEGLTPELDIPSEAATLLSRRNAKRRAELLQEFGALTGEQIAEERSRAANRHALAARWRKEGKMLGVSYRGQTVYPGFQFDDDGRPLPAVAKVLAALPREVMSDWEVGYWWTAANGWLGGARPVDLLATAPDSVVEAARRLGEPLPL
jgi:hypothetical protein